MYIDSSHSQFVLKQLQELRCKEELCDVNLTVGDSCFYAHKAVLAAVSMYFKAMFSGKMEEQFMSHINIYEVDEKSMAMLLDFAYTGHISISPNNVQILLATSNMLSISQVTSACCEFLIKQLHPSNSLGFMQFAKFHSLNELLKTCVDFTEENFLEVICYDEFLSLSSEDLVCVLSSDFLNVESESDIFTAIEQWVLHDAVERTDQALLLLSNVRLPLLSTKFINYLQSHVFYKCPSGFEIQLKLKQTINDRANPFRLLDVAARASHLPRRDSNKMFVFGGKDGLLQPLDLCEMFDVENSTWNQCHALPKPRFNMSAVSVTGSIYITGGIVCRDQAPNRTHTKSVLSYSTSRNKWQQEPGMIFKRSSHCSLFMGGFIYVIGGYDGSSCLKSVERFDTKRQEWEQIQDMHYCRSSFAAVTLDDYMYVLGGQGTGHLCTVERYDSSASKWELMPAMSTSRINFGAAVVHGFIYVIGGHDGLDYLRTVERFDPALSEWVVVAPLPSPRTGLGVIVLRNHVFAVGGHDGSRYLDSVSRYDPITDTWQNCDNMINPRCYMAIAPAYT